MHDAYDLSASSGGLLNDKRQTIKQNRYGFYFTLIYSAWSPIALTSTHIRKEGFDILFIIQGTKRIKSRTNAARDETQ